ncbi:glutaredoxin 3 [Geminocystis sp. GBBB08]|uniref:glutaredoxin 3 n=1 Tax=Geminocystis sp. GBBB08 TaxID=2604140 RepID=UPI0027E36A0F|nr:glutaredoxin 3 [Geminocystis sp. GBBB08]MBL1209627.1 glutaredoxin 3 [Geminocystis sp. GBBB08]
MSAKIEIYTWSTCPFCNRAKALLNQKQVEFIEYCIDGDREGKMKMSERANGRTSVPQIFINNNHIGGCDDLLEINERGELDKILQEN